MNPFKKAVQLTKDPNRLVVGLLYKFGFLLPDKMFLSCMMRARCGYWPNWKNPQTFCEKLQWLKLNDHRPENTMMVDKYAVKDYVAGIIGSEYVIPTLGVWDNPEQIDWDKLPDQFVLKTTHGGGNTGVVICKDKASFNREKAIIKLKKSLRQNIYRDLREWPYKNVPRRIIAEQYIAPDRKTKDLLDYKFFCFNGEPRYCQVISGRNSNMCVDFFDKDWNHQQFHEPKKYPFADREPSKPLSYELMWNLARKLSKDKAFSRIDFYEVGKDVFFGEITFYPTSGFGGFYPAEYDEIIGRLIDLSGIAVPNS